MLLVVIIVVCLILSIIGWFVFGGSQEDSFSMRSSSSSMQTPMIGTPTGVRVPGVTDQAQNAGMGATFFVT